MVCMRGMFDRGYAVGLELPHVVFGAGPDC